METIFWVGIGLILYYLFGYPILLMIWSRLAARPVEQASITPPVTIVIAAHNEEKVITEKIRNTLALEYPAEQRQIIVSSDGSDDGTVEQALALLPHAVVIATPERCGKTEAVNKALEQAAGELVVLTDANVTLRADALLRLARNFSDQTVGCVAGRLNPGNQDESSTSASVGLYWRWENFIKLKESATGSAMGADGSLFAFRRELFRALPAHAIDDFGTSMGILARGNRVVFEPEAIATERASTQAVEEFRRKVRIATRTVGTLIYLRPALSRLAAADLLKLFSHLLLRYASGHLMLAVLISNLWLVAIDGGTIYSFALAAQLSFYGLALAGILLNNRASAGLRMARYFVLMNLAALLGTTRALLGVRMPYWQSPKTSRRAVDQRLRRTGATVNGDRGQE